jgi:hypothetical protein
MMKKFGLGFALALVATVVILGNNTGNKEQEAAAPASDGFATFAHMADPGGGGA